MQTRTRLETEAVGTERARQGAAGEDHLETQNRPPEEASMGPRVYRSVAPATDRAPRWYTLMPSTPCTSWPGRVQETVCYSVSACGLEPAAPCRCPTVMGTWYKGVGTSHVPTVRGWRPGGGRGMSLMCRCCAAAQVETPAAANPVAAPVPEPKRSADDRGRSRSVHSTVPAHSSAPELTRGPVRSSERPRTPERPPAHAEPRRRRRRHHSGRRDHHREDHREDHREPWESKNL